MSDPLWRQLLLQAVLIFLNAFFASAEIAVLSLNENKVRRYAQEGDKKYSSILKVVERPTVFLSTIQIGITLAGFLGSAFAADNFAGRITNWFINDLNFTAVPRETLNTIAVVLITLILSFFTLVLGELVPKRIAMKRPEKVAKRCIGLIRGIAFVMRPITWFLTMATNGMLRLFGVNPNDAEKELSEDEIRLMVDIGEEEGAIETGEKEMIENIFEFNNMTAEDVMIHRTDMEVVWLEDTNEQIMQMIRETGRSRFPVCNEDADDIVGILNVRDYLLNLGAERQKPIQEILRPAYFVPESVRTDVLFRNMQAKKMHMAIVVDEYGGTSGLVTLEDLLERIVGNIYDEFDPTEERAVSALGDNLWRIAGSAQLEEIADELHIKIPESEEYDTLAGLIMDRMESVPEDGSKPVVETQGLHIEVEEIKDRRIEWAKVSVLPEPEEQSEDQID